MATSFAQTDSVYYFDKYGRQVNTKDTAGYSRVINSRIGDIFTFTEYHKDGTWVEGRASGSIGRPVYDTYTKIFFKIGKLKQMNEYSNGQLTKTLRYHLNGTLLQTVIYKAQEGWPTQRIVYEADSTGQVNITKGNGTRKEIGVLKEGQITESYTMEGPYKLGAKDGVWKGTDDRGIEFEETYDRGNLMSGKSRTKDGKTYKYTYRYVNATVEGDPRDLEKTIRHDFKKPADTLKLKANVLNVLSLSYTIDEKGDLQNVCGYDKNILALIKLDLKHKPPCVNPARLRGVPVASNIVKPYTINNRQQLMERLGTKNWVVGTTPLIIKSMTTTQQKQ